MHRVRSSRRHYSPPADEVYVANIGPHYGDFICLYRREFL
jgi:hypothetical protein